MTGVQVLCLIICFVARGKLAARGRYIGTFLKAQISAESGVHKSLLKILCLRYAVNTFSWYSTVHRYKVDTAVNTVKQPYQTVRLYML